MTNQSNPTSFRSPYVAFPRKGHSNEMPSKTEQHHKKACDINEIMKRYKKHGVTHLNNAPQLYGDYSEVPEYQEALHIVMRAEEQFRNLPSELRNKFRNDPREFLSFCEDSNNLEEMYALGLAERSPKQNITSNDEKESSEKTQAENS